ncbi:hypothetical protein ES703_119555 [subsurface metagenome]
MRDENNANPIFFLNVSRGTSDGFSVSISFNPPAEIPALWDILIESLAANLEAFCFIHGYEA